MDLKELKSIADRDLARHQLHGWTFALDNSRRRLGVCRYRTRRIEIAEFYARHNPPETVLDTLLHEIAHAIAGPGSNHGLKWKAIAIRLGATPRACDDSGELVVQPGNWQATCPACSKIIHRYRRPRRLDGYRCLCKARGPLVFKYAGDPLRRPVVRIRIKRQPNWEATCAGCRSVHLRVRRPKAGTWLCGCRHRCKLFWRFRGAARDPRECAGVS